MRFIGIDGFKGGWVVVSIDGNKRRIMYAANIAEALTTPHDIAMIDMPIGLPARGYRSCDQQARRILGTARSRVFLGARRSILGFETREAAHNWAKSDGDTGVSCQLFCISDKFAQLDAHMTPDRQETVCETHPELVFTRLNSGKPLFAKKGKNRQEGLHQRREILIADGFLELDEWLATRRPGAGHDDVFDACACAIAARDKTDRNRIPEIPELDKRSLRMEMWY
jgi:predicted RNase H-like nuclease